MFLKSPIARRTLAMLAVAALAVAPGASSALAAEEAPQIVTCFGAMSTNMYAAATVTYVVVHQR
jgi:hypothetical protein